MNTAKKYWVKTKSFTKECKRVLQVTRKPSMEEFKSIVKVTGMGMLAIGLIGFIITLLWKMSGI
tara:strand:- start:287 stop:478 length:192 start_codon:yes stop_codon:yes gene_type:complete